MQPAHGASPGPQSPASPNQVTVTLNPPLTPTGQWSGPPQMFGMDARLSMVGGMMNPRMSVIGGNGDPRMMGGMDPRMSVMGGYGDPRMSMVGGLNAFSNPGMMYNGNMGARLPSGTVIGPSGEVYNVGQNPYGGQEMRMGAPSIVGGGAHFNPGEARGSAPSMFQGGAQTAGYPGAGVNSYAPYQGGGSSMAGFQ
jgi:hypothetical protein